LFVLSGRKEKVRGEKGGWLVVGMLLGGEKEKGKLNRYFLIITPPLWKWLSFSNQMGLVVT
jgi:hypothetical protein